MVDDEPKDEAASETGADGPGRWPEKIARSLPLALLVIFLVLLFRNPTQNANPGQAMVGPTVTGGARVWLQLKLSDLSSGRHLLAGQTIKSLERTYFGLRMVYQPPEAKEVSLETYPNVQVVEARDANGAYLARIGTNADALILSLDPASFETFIAQRPFMKNLYLVEQSPDGAPVPLETPSAPSPEPTFPVPPGEVTFELDIAETLKADLGQLRPGQPVTLIVSTQSKELETSLPEVKSNLYQATVINLLDEDYSVLPGPPYKNAKLLRVSLKPGVNNKNTLAFASDLASAVAIYIITPGAAK